MDEQSANVTQLLRAAASGERRDLDALMEAIYEELYRIAIKHMRSERTDHTLQPTAVVHEAYLKLIDQRTTDWNDRVHFFTVASGLIRRLLVDHARARRAEKRGGARQRVSLGDTDPPDLDVGVDLIALDDALKELREINARQAQVVELRFFGGLTIDEVADTLSIGKRSVDRDWSGAKAWLFCQLTGGDAEPADGA